MRERFTGVLRGSDLRGSDVDAWMHGRADRRPLRTRACTPLNEAIVFTNGPFHFSPPERELEAIRAHARLTRYKHGLLLFALLAMGLIDLVVEYGFAPYEVAVRIPVVTAVGGLVTAWDGGDYRSGGRVLPPALRRSTSGSPQVHVAALEVLRGSARSPAS